MKKITAFLLLLFMILALFACENVAYPEESAVPSAPDSYEQIVSQLPELSLPEEESESENGVWEIASFKIYTDTEGIFGNSESEPERVSYPIEERNRMIREKYNVSVETKIIAEDKIADELRADAGADIKHCDLLSYSASASVKLLTEGLLGDLGSLPGFDIEADCFKNNNALSLATNSNLYLLPENITMPFDESYVIFYNRDLLEGKVDVMPETLVLQGKWTWDKFNEYAKKSAPGNGIYGYGAYYLDDKYPMAMWCSAGKRVIDDTYKSPVEIKMSADEIQNITSNMYRSYINTPFRYSEGKGNKASELFKSGNMVFFSNKMKYFYGLRDGSSGNRFRFLPMPKYEEDQNGYYCYADPAANVLSIPKSLLSASENDKTRAGVVITALCTVGSKTVKDIYVNSYIASYLNDNTEAVVLQTIADSIFFDFSGVYGSQINAIKRCALDAVVNNIGFGSNVSKTFSLYKSSFDAYCNENFK